MANVQNFFSSQQIHLGTLLPIMSAIILAVIGFLRTKAEDRKRFTLGMLMGYSHSAELLKALHFVREQRLSDQPKLDEAVAERLAVILPHFQSIALAANKGLLDRDIVLSARYGSMKWIWDNYGSYVRAQRRDLNRPLLYVELEDFLAANASRYAEYQKPYRDRSKDPGTAAVSSKMQN